MIAIFILILLFLGSNLATALFLWIGAKWTRIPGISYLRALGAALLLSVLSLLIQLGNVLKGRGRLDQAMMYFDRAIELDRRRDEIKTLVSTVQRDIVDVATETEMIQYFDDVLNLGEEVAMRHLAAKVQGKPLP